jgi:hypothetical protein
LEAYLKADTVKHLNEVLQKYKEDAFVMLALIEYWLNGGGGIYPHSHAPAGLPQIDGSEPIAIWRLLLKINKLMLSRGGDKYIRAFLNHFSLKHSLWKREKGQHPDGKPYTEDYILSRRAEELMRLGFQTMDVRREQGIVVTLGSGTRVLMNGKISYFSRKSYRSDGIPSSMSTDCKHVSG